MLLFQSNGYRLAYRTPAFAQDKTSETDKIFSWTKPNETGCAVAVSQNGKIVVNKAYGLADLERDVPITPNTVFDAGVILRFTRDKAGKVVVLDFSNPVLCKVKFTRLSDR